MHASSIANYTFPLTKADIRANVLKDQHSAFVTATQLTTDTAAVREQQAHKWRLQTSGFGQFGGVLHQARGPSPAAPMLTVQLT